MGYLIGGAGEGPEEEIVQSDKDYSKLSDSQLLKLRDQTVKDIAKFHNFQMVRKICLNSAYGAVGTYIWAHSNSNTLTHNTTIAGSNLTALGAITAGQSNVYLYNITSGGLSGTWRSLGGSNDTRGGHHRCVALFVRIS